MAVKVKPMVNARIKAKAIELLTYAREKAPACQYSNELFNAIFSPSGQATVIFPKESDRAAFFRTKEYRDIRKLADSLPRPPADDVGNLLANGKPTVTLHLPKSVHQSLLAEAAAEGVSLDQLCLSKLVAQLRKMV
jgi:hypothetical protein